MPVCYSAGDQNLRDLGQCLANRQLDQAARQLERYRPLALQMLALSRENLLDSEGVAQEWRQISLVSPCSGRAMQQSLCFGAQHYLIHNWWRE
jgi:hypothetical protein